MGITLTDFLIGCRVKHIKHSLGHIAISETDFYML
jgi:hypothetical protein